MAWRHEQHRTPDKQRLSDEEHDPSRVAGVAYTAEGVARDQALRRRDRGRRAAALDHEAQVEHHPDRQRAARGARLRASASRSIQGAAARAASLSAGRVRARAPSRGRAARRRSSRPPRPAPSGARFRHRLAAACHLPAGMGTAADCLQAIHRRAWRPEFACDLLLRLWDSWRRCRWSELRR
jgi:hypothetical protein